MIYLASWTNPARIRDWLVGLVARLPARVQTKLLAAFLTIAGLLIVLGAVGLQVLNGVNGRTEELITLQRKIAAYHQVQHDTTTQLYSISTALLLQDDKMLDAALRQLNQFGYDLDRMEFVAKGEAELLGEVRKDYDRFTVTVTRVVDAIRAGRTAEARDMQLAEIVPLADRLERMTNQLVNIAEADMVAAIDATGRTYRTSRIIVIAFALGSLLLALGLGYVISWSLIAPVREIEARLRRIAAGEFGQRVIVANRDELGELAGNVNQTSEQLGRLYQEIEARRLELSESLEQQTATGAILRVIAASPTDIQPVLDTVAESAARLCEAYDSLILLKEGEAVSLKAHHGPMTISTRKWEMTRDWVSGRAIVDRVPVHVHDLFEAADEFPASHEMALQEGQRSIVAVPLLRKGEAIGAIAIRRLEVQPFTRKQIDLLTTFADQAVIAIENVRLFEEVQTRNRELTESLEQQTATGAILRAIAGSPTDIQPVLNAVSESAAKLCDAYDGAILLRDGESLAWRAHYGPIPIDFASWPIGRDWVTGRAFVDRKPVHVPDLTELAAEFPAGHAMALRLGHRTLLAVPLLREGEAIGALVIRRLEVRPFSEKQIDLLTTFADQAVIAIENVRLFEQVQARTAELSESLQQQTATADVLKVISRSTFDLDTVLQALVASASQLCGANYGGIYLRDGDNLFGRAAVGHIAADLDELTSIPVAIDRRSVAGRVALSGHAEHIPDILDDPEWDRARLGKYGDFRSLMGIPLLKEGKVAGVFFLGKPEPGAFTSRQAELVQTFADQAVIAIENVRLFDQVQARTEELSESLQHQTATAEVLKVISRSAFDLQTVFDTLAESAARLCEADFVFMYRLNADEGQIVANYGVAADDLPLVAAIRQHPGRESVAERILLEHKTVHVPDFEDDPEYTFVEVPRKLGLRAILGVPMLRDGALIGMLLLARKLPGPFAARQIELCETFADQAVIAIENVRLFDEVQTRTRELARSVSELKALGEVSEAVNSTLDLKTVLETIVAKAVQLSEADAGAIYVFSKTSQRFKLRATYGMSKELIEAISHQVISITDAAIGEAAQRRSPVQVADLKTTNVSSLQKVVLDAGYRSVLVVPLLRPGKIVGAFVVRRKTPGLFQDSTVELMETFAAQSVLAIQNARLFSEIDEKSHQLEVASRHKSQFLANMSHELRTPLNSVLGFTEMLVDGLYGELPERAKVTLSRVQANGRHLLGLINDVLDLSKIEAGQLKLAVESYSVGQIVKSVASATEPLARAKHLDLRTAVTENLPLGKGDERRLTQVLLNLVGNAIKFTDKGSIDIVAKMNNGFFEFIVRDTGPGIAPEQQSRIFEEFHQVDDSSTREKGGTGLGLAISKRIVELHKGNIGVESTVGGGSTFRVVLPVSVEEEVEA